MSTKKVETIVNTLAEILSRQEAIDHHKDMVSVLEAQKNSLTNDLLTQFPLLREAPVIFSPRLTYVATFTEDGFSFREVRSPIDFVE